jgi:beta-1,4-mannosyl-glycoprotein beta-1,4-N-acetylglucosaminyltransferase
MKSKPVVTEVINFLHELDLLEAHLDEHQHFIDRIVVVESEQTYSGMTKPLYFEENKDRFARFNIEHEVVPAELHVPIPASYGEDEQRKWFHERRVNRENQQNYIFNKYKKDCDYLCNADVDEIWSRDSWHRVLECMHQEYCYIGPGIRRFMYFMDYVASNCSNWRITKSDQPTHVRQKGTKRGGVIDVGWHFTSCYRDPKDLWMKGVGLAQSIGYLGWANVPDPDECKRMIESGTLPFLNQTIAPAAVMSLDDLSWLPPYMREHPELWSWLPESIREGVPISEWCIDTKEEI